MGKARLQREYQKVRRTTERLCEPLCTEDFVIQSMPDVSPPKWHLGHTSWFFERVILQAFEPGYKQFHELYSFIFNSYYQSFGERLRRDARGALSRPTVKEVYAYRGSVDERLLALLVRADEGTFSQVSPLVELGLQHEQQHQELLITDIKHILGSNPLRPVYCTSGKNGNSVGASETPARLLDVSGGIHVIGAPAEGFAWDNERPRHRVILEDFQLMNQPVSCGEYLDFIRDRGYQNALLWLSDGWDAVCREGWEAPLYWENNEGQWHIWTLSGLQTLNPYEPVSHVSFYEAAAFARWAEKRLPTEEEWEVAASLPGSHASGSFLEDRTFHPTRSLQYNRSDGFLQMLGNVWEWANSAYLPYPGYQRERGPLGEYNGKFMINQMVLRGGSCATPQSHIRRSYRNFFQCEKRWQFSGIRLPVTREGRRSMTPSYRVLRDSDHADSFDERDAFALDVLVGLSSMPKSISSKYFYDARGSELFREICLLPEYYLTERELEILERQSAKILGAIGSGPINLVELGAGFSQKTIALLDELIKAGIAFQYVPIDISESAMTGLVKSLGELFPQLEVNGLVTDYFNGLKWLNRRYRQKNLVLFLGSSIGNFTYKNACFFLRNLWNCINHEDVALIGFDMKKDIDLLLRAYNDAEGLTREFNLNLLQRINCELGGHFDLSKFRYFGTYNVSSGAMESYLVSQEKQTVSIDAIGRSFPFEPWEPLHTEYSYKYLASDIEQLATSTGFKVRCHLHDSRHFFVDSLWEVEKSWNTERPTRTEANELALGMSSAQSKSRLDPGNGS